MEPTSSTAAPPASTPRPSTPQGSGRFGTFAALRHTNYRYLFIGTMGMSAGQWVQQVTLGWLLYDLTGSSLLLGALNGLRAIPFLLIGPFAGVLADRVDRKRVVGAVALIIMSTAFLMGALVQSGHREVWLLFVFTTITGTAWAFNQPARQSLISEVVPRKDLMNAIALTSAGFNTNKVLAPVLGGMLIAAFGPGGNFVVQCLAYALVLGSVLLMRLPPSPRSASGGSMWANLKEGLAYVAKDPMVLTLMASALVPQMMAMPYQSLMPVFQKDVLGLGPEALGLLLGAPAVGALLSTLVLASVATRIEHKGRIMLVALVGWGICMVLFARAGSLPLSLLALAGVGACQVVYNATNNTILQLIVPAELRGRVMSIYFLDQGLQPAGALMGGLAAAQLGAPDTVTIMGVIVVFMALLIAWRMPRLRDWSQ